MLISKRNISKLSAGRIESSRDFDSRPFFFEFVKIVCNPNVSPQVNYYTSKNINENSNKLFLNVNIHRNCLVFVVFFFLEMLPSNAITFCSMYSVTIHNVDENDNVRNWSV